MILQLTLMCVVALEQRPIRLGALDRTDPQQ